MIRIKYNATPNDHNNNHKLITLKHEHPEFTYNDLKNKSDAELLSTIRDIAHCKSKLDSCGSCLWVEGLKYSDKEYHADYHNTIKHLKAGGAALDETLIMLAREILKSRVSKHT